MAMKTASKPTEQLNEALTRPAAGAAGVLGALMTAFLILLMVFTKVRSFQGLVMLVGWAVLFAAAVGVSVQLLLKQVWAQRFLLAFYLVALVAEITALVAVVIWGQPAWWPDLAPMVAVLVPMVVLTVPVVGLLVAASAPDSRLRFGSMVVATVAVAAALVLVVNLISQREGSYYHRSMETLGRYGLSERTRKVLAGINGKLTFTVVYTSTDKAKKTADRRERVMELLEDAKVYGRKVEVNNITNDSDKAAFIRRLQDKLGGQAKKHVEFLKKYQADAKELLATLNKARAEWRGQEPNGFLNLWGVPAQTADVLVKGTRRLEQAVEKVDKGMGGLAGTKLPDYADLVREAKEGLRPLKDDLEGLTDAIKGLNEVAKALGDEQNRKVALAAVEQVGVAAKEMAAAVGKPGAPAPDKPTEAMEKFIAAAKRTAQLAAAASRQIENIAGEDKAELVRMIRPMRFEFLYQEGLRATAPVSQYYALKAQNMAGEAADGQGVVKATKSEYQAKYIAQQLRPWAAHMQAELAAAGEIATGALARLGSVDKASKDILQLAADGKLFQAILPRLKEAIALADKLPEIKDTSIVQDITHENIIVVETDKAARVISFDEAWPLQSRPFGPAGAEEGEQRTFNGDSAIGSRLMAMTNEPYATVVIAFWGPGPDMPPQMARMVPEGDIPLRSLSTLRQRLEDCNFRVKEWNLDGNMPADDEGGSADRTPPPKVLLVLPPPPPQEQNPFQPQQMPLPSFKPEYARKVTDAIDAGTPAIFLGTFLWPRQANMFMPPAPQDYPYASYLRDEWGIDPRTDSLLIPAVTDEQNPGRYKFDPQRFRFLSLNAFTDQPIGQPLTDQRVLWRFCCPIQRTKDARGEPKAPPKGVQVETILRVPAHWKATWATSNIERLDRLIRGGAGSYIFPDVGRDVEPPMDLAVAASRAADPNGSVKPARVVVLGVGSSMMDGYLDSPVPVFDTRGTISVTDPPRANADLVINSVYWLVGRRNLIAAGPATATMREIAPALKYALVVLYCVLLPAAVVGIGGIVLWRRRS